MSGALNSPNSHLNKSDAKTGLHSLGKNWAGHSVCNISLNHQKVCKGVFPDL